MPIAESILPEFDHETATTRTLLERVPETSALEAARHVDVARPAGDPYREHSRVGVGDARAHGIRCESARWPALVRPTFESSLQLLKTYDVNVEAARALVAAASDGEFMVQWTLKNGGKSLYSLPRVAVFRSFVLNHAVHHRGQLTVYLRLLDVTIPNIYGPTADSS